MLTSLVNLAADVGSFWQDKLLSHLTSPSPLAALRARLLTAQSYETYEETAYALDSFLGLDLWRQTPASRHYDYRLIYERLTAIISARDDADIPALVNLLRSGLVRNLGNITTPRLYNKAYAGTKLLIEDYITQVALAIEYVTSATGPEIVERGWNAQAKLDLLHDTRQAFGRSTLVLQGGAMFGMCHLGVVKALHLRGLLPRIITGTATGALVAALVAIHTEDELLDFLGGEGLDLSAFTEVRDENDVHKSRKRKRGWVFDDTIINETSNHLLVIFHHLARFYRTGSFLDSHTLNACVRAYVGDLTFEEAYARTKRVLNITVATSGRGGVPNLLNYLTAPNVLIYSAALASNSPTTHSGGPPQLLLQCKDETGAIVPWASAQEVTFRNWREAGHKERESPLMRVAELFNVNHFIVSQARPYIAPFLRADLQHSRTEDAGGPKGFAAPLLRLAVLEVQHRLDQLDTFGLLPVRLRRLLVDEKIPGQGVALVPEVGLRDWRRIVRGISRENMEWWMLRGERSVWPAVGALKIRCAVEVELDRGYQVVRRRKPLDGEFMMVKKVGSRGSLGRRRAVSVDYG